MLTIESPTIQAARANAARSIIAENPIPSPEVCDAELLALDIEFAPECPVCSGEAYPLGTLGRREHFRCRCCGMLFSHLA